MTKKLAKPSEKIGAELASGSAQGTEINGENTEDKVICLAEVLTVNQVVDFKKELDQLLQSSPGSICLDASGVRSMDSAALQLILAFLDELKIREITVTLKEVSDQFLELARTLGLLAPINREGEFI